MLQLQYFNSKLKNKHITNILDNYKLKYTGIKNELSSKLNELIKLFLNDILSFLETTEEISNARKKLNNYEKMKTELDSIKNQLKIKTYNEHKIKNDLETLTQENSLLKVKLNSLNQKLNNLYGGINTSNKNISNLSKSPLINKNSKENINLITPKINLRGSANNYQKIITDFRKRTNVSAERKKSVENSFNKLDISMTSKFDYSSKVLENLEKSNAKIRNRKSNEDKYFSLKRNTDIKKEFIQTFNSNINNNINVLNTKNTNTKKKKNIKKFLINQDKFNKINKTHIDNKINSTTLFSPYQINSSIINKKNIKKEKDINTFSINNSIDNTEYEDIEKKINLAIDDELKQLEQDEEKIKKLLEKVNNGNSSELNLNEININDNQRTIGLISSTDE